MRCTLGYELPFNYLFEVYNPCPTQAESLSCFIKLWISACAPSELHLMVGTKCGWNSYLYTLNLHNVATKEKGARSDTSSRCTAFKAISTWTWQGIYLFVSQGLQTYLYLTKTCPCSQKYAQVSLYTLAVVLKTGVLVCSEILARYTASGQTTPNFTASRPPPTRKLHFLNLGHCAQCVWQIGNHNQLAIKLMQSTHFVRPRGFFRWVVFTFCCIY